MTFHPPTPSIPVPWSYRPGSPYRTHLGDGYRLSGQVLCSHSGKPVPHSNVEIWYAVPTVHGCLYSTKKDDWHGRGEAVSDGQGRFSFSTDFPCSYGRPIHIHMRITKPGRHPLVTEFRPSMDSQHANLTLWTENISQYDGISSPPLEEKYEGKMILPAKKEWSLNALLIGGSLGALLLFPEVFGFRKKRKRK